MLNLDNPKMNQKIVDEKISEYTDKGWSILFNNSHIAFLSPCGDCFHSFDKETGYKIEIDKKSIENMRMRSK